MLHFVNNNNNYEEDNLSSSPSLGYVGDNLVVNVLCGEMQSMIHFVLYMYSLQKHGYNHYASSKHVH